MDIIPRDLWPTIVAYMDDQTKQKMRLASTTWFNLIKYDNFKLYGTRSDDIPAITERLLKYNWKINLAFKRPQIIDSTIFVEHLPKLTNLRELLAYECPSPNHTKDQWMRFSTLINMEDWQFGSDVPLRLLQNFVNLRTWKRYGSEETLAPILKQMGNLSSLTFIDDSAQTWPFALVKYAEKLTSLDIFMQGRFTKGNEMWRCLTNLKRFSLVEGPEDNTIELHYLTALEHFTAHINSLPPFGSHPNLTALILKSPWSLANAKTISNLTKLQYMAITVYGQAGLEPYKYLTNLQSLKKMKISEIYEEAEATELRKVYQYLPPSLEILIPGTELDFAYITHLVNLQDLTLEYIADNCQYISCLSNLTSLQIFSVDQSCDLRSIAALTKLESLRIRKRSANQILDEYNVPNIAGLTRLRHLVLDLVCCPIQINQLENLTNLNTLALVPNAKYTTKADFPQFVSNLPNFTMLHLPSKIN